MASIRLPLTCSPYLSLGQRATKLCIKRGFQLSLLIIISQVVCYVYSDALKLNGIYGSFVSICYCKPNYS